MQIGLKQFGKDAALLALALVVGSGVCLGGTSAALSGIVRDTQGVAQMGAMVEVLAAGSVAVGTTFTDLYGRYSFLSLIPGKYQVRATAALFVPATRGNLLLATGARTTVNLTLSMLSESATWLPAERRKPDEPGDDWTWTLRSTANRPILRMLDDGQLVMVSTSASEGSPKTSLEGRGTMMGGDGEFGGGGSHTVFSLDRVMEDGSDVVMRTDVGAARTPGHGPSTEVDAGYERKIALGGVSRLVVGYQTHPELVSAGGAAGLQSLRVASAQRMKIGPAVDVEAGGVMYAVHTVGYSVVSQPFLRVTVHPGDVWELRYRLATSRDLESFAGLDAISSPVPMSAFVQGHLRVESGRHQEIAVSRKFGTGTIQAALYQDVNTHPVISGTGVMGAADMAPGGSSSSVVADTVTAGFQFLGPAYTARGYNVVLSEPLTPSLWAMAEYASGAALSTRDAVAVPLPQATAGLHVQAASSATAALKGRILRSGTEVRTAYRWQPRRLVTPVGAYDAFSDQAFLSCHLRQTVRWGTMLPPGLQLTADLTNLLAQGYQPFLSADGRTLYLAQSPRTLQAGLSFTF